MTPDVATLLCADEADPARRRVAVSVVRRDRPVRRGHGAVTCDCAPDCWCKRPGLSTVRLPLERIGELAVELAMLPSDDGPVRVSGEPLLRESAGSGGPETQGQRRYLIQSWTL